MKNFKLTVAYDGTRYSGWQRQGNAPNTVQGRIEAVLGEIFGHKIEIHGSGRTDAGVHALGQTASFAAETRLSPDELRVGLNRYLPQDIAVTAVEEMPERFHARLLARRKTYVYRLWIRDWPDVFGRRFTYGVGAMPNAEEMRLAAERLTGRHDFIGYSSLKKAKKSTVRTLESIRVEDAGDELRLVFIGDGFLYNMARIISGTLLEVGLGKRDIPGAARALTTLDRADAGPTLPACGLTLVSVEY